MIFLIILSKLLINYKLIIFNSYYTQSLSSFVMAIKY